MNLSLRWTAKKTARAAMVAAARASGYVARGAGSPQAPLLRALTYHGFGSARRDAFVVAPGQFRAQMEFLAGHGLAVSLPDVLDFVAGRKTLRPGSVLVTMDDGLRSVFTEALPVLRDLGIPAVAFITAGLVGAGAPAGAPEGYLNEDELLALVRGGIDIVSHAWSHRSLGRMPLEQAREEALRSRHWLESRVGRPVTAFAYPFGTLADFNAGVAEVLGRCGYQIAFTSQHGPLRAGADPLQLPRIKVEGGEDLAMFRQLVRGAMDGWQWVDRTLWRLQAAA